MKKGLTCLAVLLYSSLGFATISTVHTEDFNGDFPAWENNWLGTNSDLENFFGVNADRGNNPDGLWIANKIINFDDNFGASITEFSIDIATHIYATDVVFTAYDKYEEFIYSTTIEATNGALSDPGVYFNVSILTPKGLSYWEFSGFNIFGNTSIDNILVTTEQPIIIANPIPEPMTMTLLAIGSLVAFKRRRKL